MIDLFRWFLLMLALASLGCSTPDGDDMAGLTDKISNMGPGPHRAARLEEARSRTLEYLRKDPYDRIGDLDCEDTMGGVKLPVSAQSIIECMVAAPHMTFALCIESRLVDFRREYTESGPLTSDAWCRFVPAGGFQADPKWDPDQITDDDLARTAFASREGPPAWMIAAGVVAIGAGGVFVFASGWAVVLCPLDLGYGCPGDPFVPGETPRSSSSTGGDR